MQNSIKIKIRDNIIYVPLVKIYTTLSYLYAVVICKLCVAICKLIVICYSYLGNLFFKWNSFCKFAIISLRWYQTSCSHNLASITGQPYVIDSIHLVPLFAGVGSKINSDVESTETEV